jgi:hypothetical protein
VFFDSFLWKFLLIRFDETERIRTAPEDSVVGQLVSRGEMAMPDLVAELIGDVLSPFFFFFDETFS